MLVLFTASTFIVSLENYKMHQAASTSTFACSVKEDPTFHNHLCIVMWTLVSTVNEVLTHL